MTDLPGVTLLCADTTRSRAYVQTLTRADLRPEAVLFLPRPTANALGASVTRLPDAPGQAERDTLWRAAHFDPNSDISADLERLGAPVTTCATADINAPEAVAAIAALPGEVTIFSGFGGQILRPSVLGAGKKFLHIHGGYVPAFRGSTTNYYSLLAEDTIGASAIFLTEEIDAGPVLLRRRFPAPPDRSKLDHLHDSAARAAVLIEVLRGRMDTGEWPVDPPSPREVAQTYFVIHPVLKHLAVFPKDRPS